MEPLNGRGGHLKVADGAVIADNAAPPPVCRETDMTDSADQPPYEEAAAFLKLLANPNRLAVLCKLHERQHNVTELAEAAGLPQAAMSSQLALLREAGLVSCEANHRERQYYIADPRVNDTVRLLYSFFCAPKS